MRIILVVLMCLFAQPALAKTVCFVAVEDGKIIEKLGNCEERYTAASTFKIPLAAMGFDSGILQDVKKPVWKKKPEYEAYLDVWNENHWPSKWLKNSCVWYSQELTKKMGMEKFSKYVRDFNYGNMDISGNPGKNDGLTNCWLSSSLKVSPMEQISFLKKLLEGKLPISKSAHNKTIDSIEFSPWVNGWEVHGKTGSGYNGEKNNRIGWFVGWLSKGERKVLFAHLIEGEGINGLVSKELAKVKFMEIK